MVKTGVETLAPTYSWLGRSPGMSRGRLAVDKSLNSETFEISLWGLDHPRQSGVQMIMLTETGSPQLRRKKHGKLKDKDVEKSEKKRKRNTIDEVESGLGSPTKKHRLNEQPKASRSQSRPTIPPRGEPVSPFYLQTSSLYLPLPPISQKHALQGICAEHISPLILTYYPPFHGIVVSYSNAQLSTDPQTEGSKPAYARAIDEYASSFIWLTADFIIFKPRRGSVIEGYVNLQSESTLGLLCLNFFNASIERKRLPKEWKWIPGGMKAPGKRKLKKPVEDDRSDLDGVAADEDDAVEQTLEDAEGYFQDQAGRKVEGLLRFRVKNVDTSKSMDRETGFVSIEGTMLNEDEERELQERERVRLPDMGKKQLGWQNEPLNAMTGAIVNGFDGAMDIDDIPTSKHRARY
ncbi:MAG: hypothetical protein ALECFALPRED_004722 [Alectoria fallacina]|uniref:DNA-directed RNA polymerase subunit n=1 Tax=Alectoria fallacina TaxID=1903189 RepID=A0A8H3FU31_9LECA|nr:MAG: hypothetical protein ALECFALPRED_004722 [Alectoria fallacina]